MGRTTSKITMEEANKEIREVIRRHGPYSHNIIGIVLSQVSDTFGDDKANDLIDKHDLGRIYGFVKLGIDPVQRWCGKEGREHEWKREREIGQVCFRCSLLLTAFKEKFPEARREQLRKRAA